MPNKLLKRQIQKHFGDEILPEKFSDFLKVIGASYVRYEHDRIMLERSIEISSEEMMELNESEKKAHEDLKSLFHNIEEVFFSVKYPQIQLLLISPACEKVYGYPVEDFHTNPQLWYELILDEDKKIVNDNYPKMYLGQSYSQEYRIQHKDGSVLWVETKISPALNKGGKLIRIDGVTSDISERKKAHLELKTLFKNIGEVYFSVDVENKRLLQISDASKEVFGYAPEEFYANNELLSKMTFAEDSAIVRNNYRVILNGQSHTEQYRIYHKNGTIKWVETKINPTLNEKKQLTRIDGVTNDITERKQAEENIKTANENLQISIDRLNEAQKIAHLASWILDMKTNKVLRSPEFYQIFESSISECPNSLDEYLNFFHPDDRDKVSNAFKQAVQKHATYQYDARIIMKDGRIKHISANGKSIEDTNGELIKMHGTIQDVTEQKKIQDRLQEAQKIARLGNWERDIRSGRVYWSEEMYHIFGIDTHSFDSTHQSFLNLIHPDDLEFVKMQSAKYLKEHCTITYECRIITPTGVTKTIFAEGKVILNDQNEVIRTYGIVQDITERKKVEQEMQKNINELKKTNSELDKFVYSVSHDLRAPLSSMLGVIGISKEETEDTLLMENLNFMEGSIKKLDTFILDILDYSRNSRIEVKSEEINFKEVLKDITTNLKYMSSSKHNVDIKIDVNNDTPFYSDKGRVCVVLNNLISNAIRYQNPEVKDPFVNVKIDMSDTETNIIVKDNGIGISKENIEKVFEMFYRVSTNSVGSGLGLYIVKETINKLSGKIEVESELGKGTAFHIHLPNLMSKN
jgi:PAS domain S-box-containing protein